MQQWTGMGGSLEGDSMPGKSTRQTWSGVMIRQSAEHRPGGIDTETTDWTAYQLLQTEQVLFLKVIAQSL